MLIFFDEKTLRLHVKLGAEEDYTPTDEIREIMLRAEELERRKREFLEITYNPEIKKLLDSVDRINRANNPELNKAKQ